MRFWADRPDLVIPVQWYFSDGQPYVPNAGPFRSRLFHKEDEVNWSDGPMFPGLLGEDYASDRIRNVGNRPAWLANVPPPRAGKFCGSTRAWRGEGLFSLDPPLAPSPDGTSLCCGYENVTIDGSIAGGGGPGGGQGGGKAVAGTIAGGGSPQSHQCCGGTPLAGGAGFDTASYVIADFAWVPLSDAFPVFRTPILPAGTYTVRAFCSHAIATTWNVFTGPTADDLTPQFTPCPGTPNYLTRTFTLDGTEAIWIVSPGPLPEPLCQVALAWSAGGCGGGYVFVGATGGGGRPQSIAGGLHAIVGTVGGGGSPEGIIKVGGGTVGTTAGGGSPQSPFAAFYLYAYVGTVAGGGGPESPQGGM